MQTNPLFLSIDEPNVVSALESAAKNLDNNQEQLELDLSAIRRIDSRGLQALQDFAHRADEKKVKVTLNGVHVNVYKTFKVARLTRHFSFVN